MKRGWVLAALGLVAIGAIGVGPLIGAIDIPWRAYWSADVDPMLVKILWSFRVPRVLMGFLAGVGLAASGMAFQAMFRNPLATPFTLGVASGASLGSAVCIHVGWAFALAGVPAVTLCAFAGAVLTVLLVYGFTRAKRGFSTGTMLLAGVAVSFFFSSVILFLQYVSDFTQTYQMLRWVMGGLNRTVDFVDVLTVFPFIVAGTLIVLYLSHELNLIATGEQLAASRGVEVERTKKMLFLAASMMVGAVVSVCGPIGFVGLMSPHICRMLIGPDHRYLAPATFLFGGAFLVTCDAGSRTICDLFSQVFLGHPAPIELPVGIITALLGGPFFLGLLLTRSTGGDLP